MVGVLLQTGRCSPHPSPQAPADPPLAPERAPYSPRGSPGLTGSLSLRAASLPSIHCPFHPSRCWQHHFSNSKSEAPAPCRAATGSHRTGCHLQHLGAAFPPSSQCPSSAPPQPPHLPETLPGSSGSFGDLESWEAVGHSSLCLECSSLGPVRVGLPGGALTGTPNSHQASLAALSQRAVRLLGFLPDCAFFVSPGLAWGRLGWQVTMQEQRGGTCFVGKSCQDRDFHAGRHCWGANQLLEEKGARGYGLGWNLRANTDT